MSEFKIEEIKRFVLFRIVINKNRSYIDEVFFTWSSLLSKTCFFVKKKLVLYFKWIKNFVFQFVCLDYEELNQVHVQPPIQSSIYIFSSIYRTQMSCTRAEQTLYYFCLIFVNFTHFSCFIKGYKFYTFVIGFSWIQNCEISNKSISPPSLVGCRKSARKSEQQRVESSKNPRKWRSLHLSVGPQTYLDSLIYLILQSIVKISWPISLSR